VLPQLLLALAAVVAVGRLLGVLFRRIGQPPVIGEVVGGILLGPSLLGLISPAAYAFLLPQESAPLLGLVAQIGVLAMSITAFPVLARILSDLGIAQTGLGTIAIACAAANDSSAMSCRFR
jgi:Kef-type K+ transport system membrane component KefB